MKLGIHFGNFTFPGGEAVISRTLRDTAVAADRGGVSRFTLMDHFFQMDWLADASEPMLEGYTSLGFLAAATERIELGLQVTGVTYRHPGLLAKTLATLDVLSDGRALLGIGAGWYEREHLGLGVPFPPLKERFERLEEAILVCRQMWGDDDGPFDGVHYRLAETLCRPRPVRAGGIPILVGGGGERKTLRLVAQYADSCNVLERGGEVAHKFEVLRGHCDDVGRDYAEIEKTILSYDQADDPDEFLRQAEGWAALGVDLVSLRAGGDDPAAWVERLARDIVPRLADITPTGR